MHSIFGHKIPEQGISNIFTIKMLKFLKRTLYLSMFVVLVSPFSYFGFDVISTLNQRTVNNRPTQPLSTNPRRILLKLMMFNVKTDWHGMAHRYSFLGLLTYYSTVRQTGNNNNSSKPHLGRNCIALHDKTYWYNNYSDSYLCISGRKLFNVINYGEKLAFMNC